MSKAAIYLLGILSETLHVLDSVEGLTAFMCLTRGDPSDVSLNFLGLID